MHKEKMSCSAAKEPKGMKKHEEKKKEKKKEKHGMKKHK